MSDDTKTTRPTVALTALPNQRLDRLEVNVSAELPAFPGVAGRAAEIGLPGIRDGIAHACREAPAVVKLVALNREVAAHKKSLADAEAVLVRVQAAKTLLEHNPEAGLAAKLRAVEAEEAAAVANKAAAGRDLATIRRLVPKLYAPAAAAVHAVVDAAAVRHLAQLDDAAKRAQADLAAACDEAARTIERALAALVSPAADLLALKRASASGWAAVNALVSDVRDAVIGGMPPGVQGAHGVYRVTPEPAGEPADVVSPSSTSRVG